MKEKKKSGFKSIKVKDKTHKDLKDMGIGISQAVESMTRQRKKDIEEKFEKISEQGEQIADILLESGLFDLRFKGVQVTDLKEVGNELQLHLFVRVQIPAADVRAQILKVINDGIERESAPPHI